MEKLLDRNGNNFFGAKTTQGKNVEEIVKLIKPIAYEGVGSGGGFYHDFFLLPNGRIVSFHYATGFISISSHKRRYTKKHFNGEKIHNEFMEETEKKEEGNFNLCALGIKNLDESGEYQDEDFSNIKKIANNINRFK